jgi:carbon-monoxide dehydrogenase medium subunit
MTKKAKQEIPKRQGARALSIYIRDSLFPFMYPKSFDYFSPKSLSEALELLHGSDSEVRVLAGGQSLIPSLKSRSLSLKGVIDITGIKELDYIRRDGSVLRIGALTTNAILESSNEIESLLPILKEASRQIADPLVRNMGTIGGNLCHADPVNDLPAVMLALNATIVAASKEGTRRIDADSFFVDSFKTALVQGEILTEVEIPLVEGKVGGAYRKVKKGSGGFSIAGVASYLSVADDDTISSCRIGLTAVGPKAVRALAAERSLQGTAPTASELHNAAQLALEASHSHADLNTSEDYRRKVLVKLVKEATSAAYDKARETR